MDYSSRMAGQPTAVAGPVDNSGASGSMADCNGNQGVKTPFGTRPKMYIENVFPDQFTIAADGLIAAGATRVYWNDSLATMTTVGGITGTPMTLQNSSPSLALRDFLKSFSLRLWSMNYNADTDGQLRKAVQHWEGLWTDANNATPIRINADRRNTAFTQQLFTLPIDIMQTFSTGFYIDVFAGTDEISLAFEVIEVVPYSTFTKNSRS